MSDYQRYMQECARHISNPEWLIEHVQEGYSLDLTPDQMKNCFLAQITPEQFADSQEALKARTQAKQAQIDARVEQMRTDWNIR